MNENQMQKFDTKSKILIILYATTMVFGVASAVIMAIEKPFVEQRIYENPTIWGTGSGPIIEPISPVYKYKITEFSPLNNIVLHLAGVSFVLFVGMAYYVWRTKKSEKNLQ